MIVDHGSGELIFDAALRMDRFGAADLLREVTTERFGSLEAAVASGLALRYDGGPCFRSDHYQVEIDHLGISRSPFAVARQAQIEGAEVLLTGFGRSRRLTGRAAKRLDAVPDVLELDVNEPSDLDSLATELDERWGRVDGVLHAIAYAPPDALGGEFLAAPPESAELAFRTSAYSMKALAAAAAPLMSDGGAIVGLDFDATVAWPVYDWMGVSKAALEAVNRYLCRDLGPLGIRSNLVSAGPIETAAAGGIAGFSDLADSWWRRAPLGWDSTDPGPVADTICFLLSDASRGISGQILRVDGGFSAIGTEVL